MSGTRAVEVMIFGKGGFEGSLMFTSQQIAIGREPAAMVRLDDPMVSLRHAVMFFEGDVLHVRDLGSRTGTRVNGKSIGTGPIKATDELSIGPFRLRFTIHRSAAEAPASANGGLAALIMPTPMGAMSPTQPPAAPTREGTRESPRRASVRPPPASVRPPPMPAPAPVPAAQPPPVHVAQLHTVPLDAASLRAARPVSHVPEPVPAAPPVPPFRPRQASEDEATLVVQDSMRSPKQAFVDVATSRYDPPRSPGAVVVPERSDGYAGAAARLRDEPVANQFAVTQAASTGPNVSQLVQSLVPAVAVAATPPQGREGALLDERPILAKKAPLPEHPEPIALARRDHDDDDEEDDADFVAPFDLLGSLSGRGLSAGAPADPSLSTVEVVRFRDDRVISVTHLDASPLTLPGSKTEIGARGRDGGFDIFPKACGGAVTVRGPGATAGAPAAESTLRLIAGTQVLIAIADGEGLLVHLVPRAPQLPPPRAEFKPTADRVGPIASSAGMHVAIALLVGIVVLGGKTEAAAEVNEGRFATIDVKEIELEPPPPKPPDPDPVPSVEVPASKEPPMPVPNQPHMKVPKGARAERAGQEGGPPSASAQKILSALGGATGPALNVESITNLDAIPHGTGGFKVSGVVGKAPGDTLRVSASSGDTTVNTKSAAELGNVGRVAARSTGDGVVRGRVTVAPPAVQGEGHLDRGEIQRVINAHIYQVQGCYERQLMKDPSLSGKVSFQWLITPSGAVSSVRVGSSTLRSTEATTCIQSAIGRWTFPAPQGGSVTVTYPFSFVGN